MSVEVHEYLEVDCSFFLIGLAFFLISFLPVITYWMLIRKNNINLAKKIDKVIIILTIFAIIGLALSSIIRIREEEGIIDGWVVEEGSANYYEISEFGMGLLFISIIIMIIITQLFSIKVIRYKKIIRVCKIYLSILIILFIFILLYINFKDSLEDEQIQHDISRYNIGGRINPDNSIELVYNNYNEVYYLKLENDKLRPTNNQ